MTVTLTVYRGSWRAEIARTVAALPGLIPVVKGNGYGFGRRTLMPIVAELADTVAVGSVYELESVTDGLTPLVLTPATSPPDRRDAMLDVGSSADIGAVTGWPGRVVIKLRSSMARLRVHARTSWWPFARAPRTPAWSSSGTRSTCRSPARTTIGEPRSTPGWTSCLAARRCP